MDQGPCYVPHLVTVYDSQTPSVKKKKMKIRQIYLHS